MSTRKLLAIAGVGILTGVLGMMTFGYLSMDQRWDEAPTASQLDQTDPHDSAEVLDEIKERYSALKGEAYDRNFIANMMAHHDGAVEMARLAKTNAKHQELKDMADRIISDQTLERTKMLNWQKKWGYPPTSEQDMQDHSAMGMMDDMTEMKGELRGKTGDVFDRTFLELMIEHHESAMAMAKAGPTNAEHQEMKELTQAIIDAQGKEVAQMHEWQHEWGYITD